MTKEEFSEQAISCPECGDEPILRHDIKETMFTDKPPKEVYFCKCPCCEWMGLKSGFCKSPEGAVKSWNKKVALYTELHFN